MQPTTYMPVSAIPRRSVSVVAWMAAGAALIGAALVLALSLTGSDSKPAAAPSFVSPDTRFDGGPEEGTRGVIVSAPQSPALDSRRFDGGPEEGTRGPRR